MMHHTNRNTVKLGNNARSAARAMARHDRAWHAAERLLSSGALSTEEGRVEYACHLDGAEADLGEALAWLVVAFDEACYRADR